MRESVTRVRVRVRVRVRFSISGRNSDSDQRQRTAAESAPVFDRHHRGNEWPIRTQAFVPATRRPGPLCSEHSDSASVDGELMSL